MLNKQGALYLCATPIGNLGDITLRALACLKTSDLIVAEDTRRAKILLDHYRINVPLYSYHAHSKMSRAEAILERLTQGQQVVFVSDAGMPAISDPGSALVLGARKAGVPVIPLPGASAVITALAASGMPADRFVFWGFLSRRLSKRKNELAALAGEGKTSILFEAPHRLCRFLKELYLYVGGERKIVIARELTKKFEEIRSATLKEHLEFYTKNEPRGELTLIIAGSNHEQKQRLRSSIIRDIEILVQDGFADQQAVKAYALLNGIPKKEIYKLWVSYKRDQKLVNGHPI